MYDDVQDIQGGGAGGRQEEAGEEQGPTEEVGVAKECILWNNCQEANVCVEGTPESENRCLYQ